MQVREKLSMRRLALLACAALLVAAVGGCRPAHTDQTDEVVTADTPQPDRVTPEQVKAWMDEGVEITFVDSRNATAWRAAVTKIPGAVRVPANQVDSHLSEIPRDSRIVAYCT